MKTPFRTALVLAAVAFGLTSCRPAQEAPAPPAPAAATAASPAATAQGSATATFHGLTEEQFKALHEPVSTAPALPTGQMIDLPGTTTRAYLSLPVGQAAPLPGITVIHEWWGLNDNVKHWADRLAKEGYAALAVDIYEGKVATNPDEAMALMKAVDPARAREILLAAHQFLATDASIQAPKRGSIGWCFGGGQSLQLALAAPDLDACVIYYGFLVTDAAQLAAIKAPICGVFGTKDQGIPPAEVAAFGAALTTAGVAHEIHNFDAEHAFANPSGSRYDQPAATAAWETVRTFLAARLR